jgi:hypothetical protein
MDRAQSLLNALRTRGVVAGGELASILRVSRPTLARLVTAAGAQVCRIGQARASRYALTRSLPVLGARLPIRRVDEAGKAHEAGTLHLLQQGRHWDEAEERGAKLFDGLPPFADDMSPQGYMGRRFSTAYPELGLPARLTDWNDDHRLIALARRGEDCFGSLIIGDESFSRFLSSTSPVARREEFPALARRSLEGQPGSSAGGEQPKFAVAVEGQHVLVKFAGGEAGAVTTRWQDLLIGEQAALAAIRAAGIPAASTPTLAVGGMRFLEVERFDRVGPRGRCETRSLYAIAAHELGYLDDWTLAARDLLQRRRIDAEDARRMRWLDAFGQLIANTDRHFENVAFFGKETGQLRLAPAYDMAPMFFAPQGANLIERRFEPRPPSAAAFDVWPDAARHAADYWAHLSKLKELSPGFRRISAECGRAVEELIRRVPI